MKWSLYLLEEASEGNSRLHRSALSTSESSTTNCIQSQWHTSVRATRVEELQNSQLPVGSVTKLQAR